MYRIAVSAVFQASHALRLTGWAGGGEEPLHGHDWGVRVLVEREGLDEMETVMDFHELERLVGEVVGPMRNRHLNDLRPFDEEVNPSAERVAWWIGTNVAKVLPEGVELVRVEVTEAAGCVAMWIG